ncbi:LytR/AlgR family response regulator transcription factor [Pseudoduganella umbonata]|uniref:Response regulator transcription factor n=1 Tax=Pseudoduganella umbonata TaxID=864828 RepID=A0A4P8HRI6_9BURK|nr:LytTR family DNA-binding domain-containing protein [Pseudoduganella umbonata]MBB3224792.1 two-component system LytT family response regulator [Pseudoduganella umbonata]QCP11100.1 response regulator transcription factor [Pseudoduganella umbonata]
MMRALVIDDEPLARAGVLARLRQCPDIDVVAEYGDGPAALAGIRDARPDLVFLDVDMPGLNGLDVLAALPPAERPLAVLLTAYEQFAVQAFALDVVDYLLKPVEDERFAEAVARTRQAWRFRHQAPEAAQRHGGYLSRFTVRYGSRLVFVDAGDVDWIDAAGDYATLHAAGREYLVRTPLHRLAESLDPAAFVRVHRSAIVRLDRVAELRTLGNRDAVLRLRDGTPLRASRTYIDALLAALERQRTAA